MAWIESHQSLLTHRKTLRASLLLKVDRYKLIGHLHALWWWSLDNAKDDGELGAISAAEIAEAAGWPTKKADEFVAALVSVGFIDAKNDVSKSLHNWRKYAGKLNEKRAKDRARKSEVAGNSTGIPLEVARKSQAPTNPPSPTVPTNPPTDGEDGGARRNIFTMYESLFGPIHPLAVENLKALEEEHPEDCIRHCFAKAAAVTPRPKSLSYVVSMLNRHRREGCNGESNGAHRREQATGNDPGEVEVGVRDLDDGESPLAFYRRTGQLKNQGVREVGA